MNKFYGFAFLMAFMVIGMFSFSGVSYGNVESTPFAATAISDSMSNITEDITDIMVGIIPLVITVGVLTGIVGWAGGFGDMFGKKN
jgi:hypothetical protein